MAPRTTKLDGAGLGLLFKTSIGIVDASGGRSRVEDRGHGAAEVGAEVAA